MGYSDIFVNPNSTLDPTNILLMEIKNINFLGLVEEVKVATAILALNLLDVPWTEYVFIAKAMKSSPQPALNTILYLDLTK